MSDKIKDQIAALKRDSNAEFRVVDRRTLDALIEAAESQQARIEKLEAAATYLSAEVKDAWIQGRISVDTFNAALAMDKALSAAEKSKELELAGVVEAFFQELVINKYKAALELIANANAKAHLSSRDCELIARQALGWDIDRIYPVDY